MTEADTQFAGSEIVLASASRTRRALLDAAGVRFHVEPAWIDEDEIKLSMTAEGGTAANIAETLAEHKARAVSRKFPGVLVLGADQVLDYDGGIMSKPVDRVAAFEQLRALRGADHSLVSCACIVLNGERIWHDLDVAHLRMRDFSDDFANVYLDAVGDIALEGPGAYRIEGLGAQLFARVTGSHFTILGLPLLPLLDYLRIRGVLMS